jgi:hypothetical protein
MLYKYKINYQEINCNVWSNNANEDKKIMANKWNYYNTLSENRKLNIFYLDYWISRNTKISKKKRRERGICPL